MAFTWKSPKDIWKGEGIYHLTFVVAGRRQLLGELVAEYPDVSRPFYGLPLQQSQVSQDRAAAPSPQSDGNRRIDLILMATKNEENWMMHYNELKAYVAVLQFAMKRYQMCGNMPLKVRYGMIM